MKIFKYFRQLICRHKMKGLYVYRLTADYRCEKCGKIKKDYTLRIRKSIWEL